MTEDHQDENLPNSEEPKAIVRRLTWPIDPSLPSRDVKTDRGPGGGSTAIPLGCDRRTRKFSSPLAPSSTCASQGRHHHRCARQHRRRVRPKVATIKLAIATVQVSSRRPASESPSQVRIITARRAVHPRSSPAAPSSTFQGLHHQRRTRPHRVIFLLPPTQGFKNQVSAHPLKTKIEKLLNTRIRAIAHWAHSDAQ